MLRSLIVSALALTLFFTAASCSRQVTAAGRKGRAYNQFSFVIDNRGVSKATIYKRYIHKRKKTADYWAVQKKGRNYLWYNALGHWPWEFMEPGGR